MQLKMRYLVRFVFIIIILLTIQPSIFAQGIKQRSLSSEPKLTIPSEPKIRDGIEDEPLPPEEPELDTFIVKDPETPQQEEPFKYLSEFYDDYSKEPTTGEPDIRLNPNLCPPGLICDDIENSLKFEPPYSPSEPYVKKPGAEP